MDDKEYLNQIQTTEGEYNQAFNTEADSKKINESGGGADEDTPNSNNQQISLETIKNDAKNSLVFIEKNKYNDLLFKTDKYWLVLLQSNNICATNKTVDSTMTLNLAAPLIRNWSNFKVDDVEFLQTLNTEAQPTTATPEQENELFSMPLIIEYLEKLTKLFKAFPSAKDADPEQVKPQLLANWTKNQNVQKVLTSAPYVKAFKLMETGIKISGNNGAEFIWKAPKTEYKGKDAFIANICNGLNLLMEKGEAKATGKNGAMTGGVEIPSIKEVIERLANNSTVSITKGDGEHRHNTGTILYVDNAMYICDKKTSIPPVVFMYHEMAHADLYLKDQEKDTNGKDGNIGYGTKKSGENTRLPELQNGKKVNSKGEPIKLPTKYGDSPEHDIIMEYYEGVAATALGKQARSKYTDFGFTIQNNEDPTQTLYKFMFGSGQGIFLGAGGNKTRASRKTGIDITYQSKGINSTEPIIGNFFEEIQKVLNDFFDGKITLIQSASATQARGIYRSDNPQTPVYEP